MLYFCVILTGMVFRLYVLSHGGLHLWAPYMFFHSFLLPGNLSHIVGVISFLLSFKGGIEYIPGPAIPLSHAWGWLRMCMSKNPLLHQCSVCQTPTCTHCHRKIGIHGISISHSIFPRVFSTPMPIFGILGIPPVCIL